MRMLRRSPPLPTPRKLWLHCAAGGILTSKLITESEVDLATETTRQNSGVSSAVEEPGGVNCPAATFLADVTVTSGIFSLTRSPQLVADAGRAPNMSWAMLRPNHFWAILGF